MGIPTLLLRVGKTSQSARTLFSIAILLASYEVKQQRNVFRRVEHELEKCFQVAFLDKKREERWREYFKYFTMFHQIKINTENLTQKYHALYQQKMLNLQLGKLGVLNLTFWGLQ